eukprot:830997-Prorocentrum_minimum.AAC.3
MMLNANTREHARNSTEVCPILNVTHQIIPRGGVSGVKPKDTGAKSGLHPRIETGKGRTFSVSDFRLGLPGLPAGLTFPVPAPGTRAGTGALEPALHFHLTLTGLGLKYLQSL